MPSAESRGQYTDFRPDIFYIGHTVPEAHTPARQPWNQGRQHHLDVECGRYRVRDLQPAALRTACRCGTGLPGGYPGRKGRYCPDSSAPGTIQVQIRALYPGHSFHLCTALRQSNI